MNPNTIYYFGIYYLLFAIYYFGLYYFTIYHLPFTILVFTIYYLLFSGIPADRIWTTSHL